MKFLKFLLFLLLIIVIGGALYFATQDGSYTIESSTEINAPKEVIFDIVNDLKTWENWGPWKQEDPTMVLNYAENTVGEGASYSWQGDMDGSMETIKVIPPTNIRQKMTLQTPAGERTPEVYWAFESLENLSTKVTWGIEGEHTLLDKVYKAISSNDFEVEMKEMQEKGLENLKAAARKAITEYSITIDGLTQYSGGFYLYRTTSAKANQMAQIMGQNYQGIEAFMKKENILKSGMPFTIYNETMDNGDVIMTNALPVREKIVVPGETNILGGYMPTVTAVKVTAKGNYTNLGEAWATAMNYVQEKGYELASEKPFEVYVTDPSQYPNPADWITEVYVPVKDIE